MGATSLQTGGEHHGQDRRPLCKLWWKVRSCLPSPLGAAVLPQSLQDQLPCKNSQGLCAHEKVVWLISSRGDVDAGLIRRRAVVAATRSPASLWHRITTFHWVRYSDVACPNTLMSLVQIP